ncbi:IS3 family transposase [Flavobacterium saliperosum]|uniref:IS3 family transposase n=1 Tax=Flavobacterium saliperosum TaxID=329186 RepID=UPI001EE1ECDC|nr:IS3 family transposase [Flavobacterium saliperosum]
MSRQGFYKKLNRLKQDEKAQNIIIEKVKQERKLQPHYGGKKLYKDLQSFFVENQIKIGRDAFLKLLKWNNLQIKKSKNFHTTTNSKHRFFRNPNRLNDLVITRSEQVWVSDITYIKIQENHAYLALVTDAYSKKIMGYKIANHMRTELVLDALKMALKNKKHHNRELIHHSDRGIQYCSPEFTQFAENNGIKLSNTQNSDPYENAIAERINRTIKYEYGLKQNIPDLKTAEKMVEKAVELYNNRRLHLSLNYQTPALVHLSENVIYKSYKSNKKKRILA